MQTQSAAMPCLPNSKTHLQQKTSSAAARCLRVTSGLLSWALPGWTPRHSLGPPRRVICPSWNGPHPSSSGPSHLLCPLPQNACLGSTNTLRLRQRSSPILPPGRSRSSCFVLPGDGLVTGNGPCLWVLRSRSVSSTRLRVIRGQSCFGSLS